MSRTPKKVALNKNHIPLLSRNVVFFNSNEECLIDLHHPYKLRKFHKNQIIESTSAASKEVHFIISGGIKRTLKKSKTREHIFDVSYSNSVDCFYIEWLSKVPSNSDLVSISNDTLIISFLLTDWDQFLLKHPSLREKFIDHLFFKYQKMESRLTKQLLCSTSKERYRSALQDSPELNWELTKKEIGAFIGVAPETISRLLSQTFADCN